MKSQFQNCKIIGSDIDVETYLRQEPDVNKGDPKFVMQRSELIRFFDNPNKWLKSSNDGGNKFGELLDCILLTPEKFEKQFAVAPKEYACEPTKKDPREFKPWNFQATVCKDWREEMESRGLKVVKSNEIDEVRSAEKIFLENPFCADLLAASDKQVMVVGEYHDHKTGIVVPVKSLLDFAPRKDSQFKNVLGDLKTTESAKPSKFEWSIFNYGYDAQAYLNMELFNQATGEERDTWQFLIQENTAPFHCPERQPWLTADFLQIGMMKVLNALEYYSWCIANDSWPGYPTENRMAFGTGYGAGVWPNMMEKAGGWQAPEQSKVLIREESGDDVTT